MNNYKGSIHRGGLRDNEIPMGMEGSGNEISATRHDEILAKHIAEKLASDLNINYGDRTFVERLMFSSIKEMVRDLLREYENVVADKIFNRIKGNMKYDHDVKIESTVDYTHSAHAKLSSLFKEIDAYIVIPNKNKKNDDKEEK